MGGAQVSTAEVDVQPSFVAEVFHNLSQPLTALHCSLELALFRDCNLEDLRGSVEAALQSADCLRQRLLLLRDLNDALDPGDLSQPTDLHELLTELHQELLPLFDSAGQQFDLGLECGPRLVRANKNKLMRALFYFLEYLFRYSPPGATLSLQVHCTEDRQAEISVAAASCLPVAPSAENESVPPCSCEIEIARRTLQSVGGNFVLVTHAPNHTSWKLIVPLA
jgi:signal transduction histidine kinase